ncbi:hypothetical protein CRUP_008052 [Coryphaenoides rupestris]|nr:hypothetical protein CRUP_008052 [Coryphaenoides rupestris]
MDLTLSQLLVNFMESPLVVWIQTLGPLGSPDGVSSEDRVNVFMELVDGVFLHKIMTQIDPSPTNQRLNKNVNNDVSLRLYNLTVLTRQIRNYYQETLQQLIVMTLPNVLCIAKDPLSGMSMEEMKRLLLLILGCAVQCERKEEMIEKIKLLDIQTQAAIVCHIQEVTHNQLNVLDLSWLDDGAELAQGDLDPLSRNMAVSLQQLIEQRDKANEERDFLSSQQRQDGYRSLSVHSPERGHNSGGLVLANGGPTVSGSEHTKEEKHHLSVELADTKAKLRRYRQELEDKTEQVMDSRHEVERLDQELQRLRQENQSLSTEARFVRAYQDEMDSLKERASRVDRLETELARCKEKLNDVHFYKTRAELSASRGRCDKLHSVEKDNLLLRAKIHDVEMELVEENMLLEIGQKQSMNESAHLGWELEQLAKNHDNANTETRKSLIQELNEGVSSRLLKLEKENQELQASTAKLCEENQQLQEQQLSAQELERENQRLGKKGLVDQERLTNQDMESLGEELLKEKQTLERELHVLRAEKDRQISELERERQHLSEAVTSLQERAQANSEARVREVEVENRQLHQGLTDAGSRLASLECQLKFASEEASCLRERAGRCEEAEQEAVRLERCRDGLKRELASLRSASERAEALEKEVASLEQESRRLKREVEEEARREAQRLVRSEEDQHLLTQENLELRRSSEGLRLAAARLAALQEEHGHEQQERQELAGRLEEARQELRAERRQAEQNTATLGQEKRRLEEALERSRTEREEAERTWREDQEREAEEARRREASELREERRRREEAEEERRRILQDLEQSEKERKAVEKETWRLRTQLEASEVELEERQAQLAEARRQSAVQGKEELEKVGLNRERLLQQEHCLEDSKYRLLESRLEDTVQQAMKLRENKICEQLKQLDSQNSSLNSQMAVQQRHTGSLQEQNTSLHMQTAKLQVENSTLSSQSASLMAQNAVLQGQVAALETEAESWQRQRDEAWQGRESMLSDHERLHNVHERQAHEYEQLISQHAALKVKQRSLEGEHRTLHNKYCSLLQHKEKWEAQEGRGHQEKEELNQEVEKNRLLQQESLQLKAEVDRVTHSQSQVYEQCEGLQQRTNELKSLLSTAQTETSHWMKQYDSLMEQHRGLDLSMTKLNNHRELLSRLKGNLEEENHHLLSQINLLSQQNHMLLERSMESKELYHQEQKLYIDKLNDLRRHKEKLEEKIMDQYKFYDPTPKNSRERAGEKDTGRDPERAKSAPDIPLPSPPPLLPEPQGDTPPPLPPRAGSDTPDVVHAYSTNNNHSSPILRTQSPAGQGLCDKGRGLYRNSTPGGSSDNITGEEAHGPSQRALSSTPSQPASSSGLAGNSKPSAGASCRPRGLVFDEDSRLNSPDSIMGHRGNLSGRPGSSDLSHNTSGSNSPRSQTGRVALPASPVMTSWLSANHSPPCHVAPPFLMTTPLRELSRNGGPLGSGQSTPARPLQEHRGEVAMVSPVRAVPAQCSDDTAELREGLREGRPADSSHTKKEGERARGSSAERPKSTPASPDPNNDPQTVWYEYGCV